MKTYFLSNIDTFFAYCGKGILPFLAIAAAVYILLKEKSIYKKLILGLFPVVYTVIFFFPLTRMIFEKVGMEDGTYYRMLWLFSMVCVIAYAACIIFYGKRRIGIAAAVLAIIVCSKASLVYRSKYITLAENKFHIPNAVIHICNLIEPNEGEPRIRAAFPPELVYFVRQYNTNIMMPYGRDYVEAQWDYWNPVCEQMNVTSDDGYKIRDLVKTTRESKCMYVILNMSIPTDIDPQEEGLALIAQMDGYSIYKDLKAEQ